MAKKIKRTKKVARKMPQSGIMRNQFFGMMLVAVGVGALIVVMRYFIISLQVPTDIYEISTQQLIPGAQ